jgi:hypothetical protein
MSTTQFIDKLAAGNASGAKDMLNDMLSARAFEALEGRKVEIAQNIFNGSQVQEEQLNLEDYSLEELKEFMVSEDFEQLDELSKEKYRQYLDASRKEVKKYNSGSQLSRYGDTAGDRGIKQAGKNVQDRELNTQNAQDHAKKKLGISTVKKHTPV